MKIVMNGNQVDVPDQNGQVYVKDLWKLSGASPGRHQLVLQRPKGGNVVLSTPSPLAGGISASLDSRQVKIDPGSFVSPVMTRIRGEERR